MDKGPWQLFNRADGFCLGVISDDFDRDALLTVNADFETPQERLEYCTWLRDTLNRSPKTTGGSHGS